MAGLLLLVIFPAPDVVMNDRFFRGGGFRQNLFVEVGFEDRFDAVATVRFEDQGTAASGFQALGRVAFSQPDDTQTGTEALLRVSAAL